MIYCNRDCNKCMKLNVKTDDKGYPWGYECLKYGDSVFQEKFRSTKEFPNFQDSHEIPKRRRYNNRQIREDAYLQMKR